MKTFDQIREASVKSDNVLSEKAFPKHASQNIISRLTGGHGRYMDKLKRAHDHHVKIRNAHASMEDKLGKAGSDDEHSDEEGSMSFNHYMSHEEHHAAASAIKKLAYHAKKNKLTHHPVAKSTDSEGNALLHKARKASAEAHASSHDTYKKFHFRSQVRPHHMDNHNSYRQDFKSTKYGPGDHHKNLK